MMAISQSIAMPMYSMVYGFGTEREMREHLRDNFGLDVEEDRDELDVFETFDGAQLVSIASIGMPDRGILLENRGHQDEVDEYFDLKDDARDAERAYRFG